MLIKYAFIYLKKIKIENIQKRQKNAMTGSLSHILSFLLFATNSRFTAGKISAVFLKNGYEIGLNSLASRVLGYSYFYPPVVKFQQSLHLKIFMLIFPFRVN